MLFFVEGLGVVQGDIGDVAVGTGLVVVTAAENSILKIVGAAHHGTEGLLTKGDHMIIAAGELHHGIGPALAQQYIICAGNHITVGIDNTKYPVGGIL